MDEADAANEHMERERATLLAQRKPAGPAHTGFCANCNAPLPRGWRFCDTDCRDDYEKDPS